jgi:hypothetical protein
MKTFKKVLPGETTADFVSHYNESAEVLDEGLRLLRFKIPLDESLVHELIPAQEYKDLCFYGPIRYYLSDSLLSEEASLISLGYNLEADALIAATMISGSSYQLRNLTSGDYNGVSSLQGQSLKLMVQRTAGTNCVLHLLIPVLILNHN